jgi:hypothetical protein
MIAYRGTIARACAAAAGFLTSWSLLSSYRRRLWLRRALALSILTAAPVVTVVSPALAYSGPRAASYADQYALTYNTQSFPKFSDDCTNFVSQAVNYGGYSMHPTSNYRTTSNDSYWFVYYPGSLVGYSYSWASANDYWNWLSQQTPGGIDEGAFYYNNGHNRAPAFTPNSVVTGDVLFYDWGTGLGISHVSMQVGWGTDQHGYYGNWVDAHTNAEKHMFWTLKDAPGNTNWMTTTVYFMHISASNN